MNDPLAALSMIFGGIGFVTGLALYAFPPVGAFFTLVSIGFAAWSYFGWGGYEPCNA